MYRYVLNLVENGHCEAGLDSSDDLDTLLTDVIRHGWEDDPDRLLTGIMTVTEDGTGIVVAVVTWAPVAGQEWPDLVIYHVASGRTERYRRVEQYPVYGTERIA